MQETPGVRVFGPHASGNRISSAILIIVGGFAFAIGAMSLYIKPNAPIDSQFAAATLGWWFAAIGTLATTNGVWMFANARRFWVSLDNEKVVIASGSRSKSIPYNALKDATHGIDAVLLIYRTGGNYPILNSYFSGDSEREVFIRTLHSKLSLSPATQP
jgi:hypothetical protein